MSFVIQYVQFRSLFDQLLQNGGVIAKKSVFKKSSFLPDHSEKNRCEPSFAFQVDIRVVG